MFRNQFLCFLILVSFYASVMCFSSEDASDTSETRPCPRGQRRSRLSGTCVHLRCPPGKSRDSSGRCRPLETESRHNSRGHKCRAGQHKDRSGKCVHNREHGTNHHHNSGFKEPSRKDRHCQFGRDYKGDCRTHKQQTSFRQANPKSQVDILPGAESVNAHGIIPPYTKGVFKCREGWQLDYELVCRPIRYDLWMPPGKKSKKWTG